MLLADGQEDRYQGNVCLQCRGGEQIVYTLDQIHVHMQLLYTCVGARNIFSMYIPACTMYVEYCSIRNLLYE